MIEAIERTDKTYALGVQFHPEAAVVKNLNNVENAADFMSLKKALRFFEYLLDAASSYKAEKLAAAVGEFTDVRYVLYLGINDKEFKQSSVMIQANPTKTEFYGG